MTTQPDMEKLDEQIQRLKQAALALSDMGDDFPATKRNAARILSSIKMMEINVSDVARLDEYIGTDRPGGHRLRGDLTANRERKNG